MTEVVSVKFRDKGKVYFFDSGGNIVETGQDVIVETSKGREFAVCAEGNHYVEDDSIIPPLRPVVRVATEEDRKQLEKNKAMEIEALTICEKKIEKHGLDMKLVDAEYNFDGDRIIFFFTSDGRVDFRELVKDLASVLRTRIELRQIGVRDEAKMLGGFGICGRPFCCTVYMDEFQPVSIKMAKTQGLSLNPTKISGTCGRLMCCLKYEQEAYEDLIKMAPKVEAFVETPDGKGTVADVNLLKGTARVKLEGQLEVSVKTYEIKQLEVIGGKAKRNEYLAELEAERIQKQQEAEKKKELQLQKQQERLHKNEQRLQEQKRKVLEESLKGDPGQNTAKDSHPGHPVFRQKREYQQQKPQRDVQQHSAPKREATQGQKKNTARAVHSRTDGADIQHKSQSIKRGGEIHTHSQQAAPGAGQEAKKQYASKRPRNRSRSSSHGSQDENKNMGSISDKNE